MPAGGEFLTHKHNCIRYGLQHLSWRRMALFSGVKLLCQPEDQVQSGILHIAGSHIGARLTRTWTDHMLAVDSYSNGISIPTLQSCIFSRLRKDEPSMCINVRGLQTQRSLWNTDRLTSMLRIRQLRMFLVLAVDPYSAMTVHCMFCLRPHRRCILASNDVYII